MKDDFKMDFDQVAQSPAYPAMQQKLQQAAREAITAREQMIRDLDKGLRRHMTAKRIYEYNAALAEARAQNQKLEKQLEKQYKSEEKRWKRREKLAKGNAEKLKAIEREKNAFIQQQELKRMKAMQASLDHGDEDYTRLLDKQVARQEEKASEAGQQAPPKPNLLQRAGLAPMPKAPESPEGQSEGGGSSLFSAIGIDIPEGEEGTVMEGMRMFAGETMDLVNQMADNKVQATARALEATNQEISETERALGRGLRRHMTEVILRLHPITKPAASIKDMITIPSIIG
jgi:hypothetical protein